MGRHCKIGLDYFPMDVAFHDDQKIMGLINRMGTQAVLVYLCILCRIYAVDGYYVRWDEDSLLAVSRMAWCSQEYVDDVIMVCLEKDLFSMRIYLDHGVLTSKGVQRRYLKAIKERIRKMKQVGLQPDLKRKLWLLSEDETKRLKVEMGLDDGTTTAVAEKNANEEEGFFREKCPKEKESKEKEEESKANQSRGRAEDSPAWEDAPAHGTDAPAAASPPREFDCFLLRQEKYDELCAQYGKEAVEAKLLHLQDWASERGYHLKKPEIKLRAWLAEDARKESLRREAEERAAQRAAEQPASFKKTGAHAYAQRQYTDDEYESLYASIEHLND